MKKFNLGLILILIITALLSCRSLFAPDYDKWLGTQVMPSQMDVTGKWDAGPVLRGGWGEANFIQQGRNVYGTLGSYSLRGVVSNKSLFLAISADSYVYYTARLDMKDDGSLSGIATKEAIVESPEAAKADISIITMKRMK